MTFWNKQLDFFSKTACGNLLKLLLEYEILFIYYEQEHELVLVLNVYYFFYLYMCYIQ